MTSSAERRCAGRAEARRVPRHERAAARDEPRGPGSAVRHADPSATGAPNGAPCAGRSAARARSRRAGDARCDQATTARPSSSAATAMALRRPRRAPSSAVGGERLRRARPRRGGRCAPCTWSRQATSTRPAVVTAASAIVTPPPGLTCSAGPNAPAARRPAQLQPVGRAQRHVLGAVDQRRRRRSSPTTRRGRVARVARRGAAARGSAARRRAAPPIRRGARSTSMSRRRRRAPRSRRTRSCSTGGARTPRAPRARRTARASGRARRGLQAPAPRAAVAEPDDDRGAAGRDGRGREVGAGARRGQRRCPAEPPARAERDRADAARARCTTITPLPSAATPASTARSAPLERISARDGAEGRARRGGAPAHGAQRPGVGPRARAHDERAAVARRPPARRRRRAAR